MSTLILTLAIDLPPETDFEDVANAIEVVTFEAAEHLRKCDCEDGHRSALCERDYAVLNALLIAINEEADSAHLAARCVVHHEVKRHT